VLQALRPRRYDSLYTSAHPLMDCLVHPLRRRPLTSTSGKNRQDSTAARTQLPQPTTKGRLTCIPQLFHRRHHRISIPQHPIQHSTYSHAHVSFVAHNPGRRYAYATPAVSTTKDTDNHRSLLTCTVFDLPLIGRMTPQPDTQAFAAKAGPMVIAKWSRISVLQVICTWVSLEVRLDHLVIGAASRASTHMEAALLF
jgi:hypothetical protein